jgi:DASS family divalent anion:Na+ symporter
VSAVPGARKWLPAAATLALVVVLWLLPVPEGLTPQSWHLFALFLGSIVAVVAGALPILTSSVLAVGAAVLSGTLTPAGAYAGFANGTILLIIVAFLVARAVVKCGLGERLGYLVVSLFGKSTLGLGYSVFLLDAVIAPAFPSNTARGGVLYPIVYSLARGGGSQPDEATRKRMGAYLMFCGMASLTVSSALWLTAMAANPLGAEMSRIHGLSIGFGSWLVASSVPTLLCLAGLPLLLYKVFPPDVKATPEAPAEARAALAKLGSLAPAEKVVAATFVAMVVAWGLAGSLKLDSTAIAFAGLGVLLAAGALTLKDISQEGDVLATFIWFAVLYGMSAQLNELGFMGFLGQKLAGALGGLPWLGAYLVLLVAYVLLHYLFVSQTAHLLALFGVFLDVGVKLGVPVAPLTFALLFATNYFSVLTPQGSSANLLFAGSGYLTQGELYRLGAITTVFSFLVYAVAGTPWVLLVTR